MYPYIIIGSIIIVLGIILLLIWHLWEPELDNITDYHILISAQCSPYQDWQVAAIWWSIENRWKSAYATRLLSCTKEERKTYQYSDIMPTIATPNWQYHPKTGELYQPYNRPVSLVDYFNKHTPKAPWIVVLDPDMIIRRPLNNLNPKIGNPIGQSASFMDDGLKKLAKKWCKYPDKVQGIAVPYIIHWKDLKKVSPLWLKYTERLRENKESKEIVGWMAEMFGYAFACNELRITHTIRDDLSDRPPYNTVADPYTLHFDIDHTVGEEGNDEAPEFKWNKRDYFTKDMMNVPELMKTPDRPPNERFSEVFMCINKGLEMVRPNLKINNRS